MQNSNDSSNDSFSGKCALASMHANIMRVIPMSPVVLREIIFDQFVEMIHEELVNPARKFRVVEPQECFKKYWLSNGTSSGVAGLPFDIEPWKLYSEIWRKVLLRFTESGWKIETVENYQHNREAEVSHTYHFMV